MEAAAPSAMATCPVCTNATYMTAISNGVWAGDNSLNYALPLLIVQLCLVLFISRILYLIMRPIRQPRVIAEILGGVIIGVGVMGNIPGFTAAIFPVKSLTVLSTLGNLGLVFFFFMFGIELDLRQSKVGWRVGLKELWIAIVALIVSFGLGILASIVNKLVLGIKTPLAPFVIFVASAFAISAFPMLNRMLAEGKLLTTDVGQMALSAAALNDVVAWILLSLAVALSTPNANTAVVAWILICGIGFVLIMVFVVRPLMKLGLRGIVSNEPVPEWIVALTLVGVLICGFASDTFGMHAIFGPFVFGLCIPKDGPFATMILEKIEDFTMIILLPLFYASSGLAVNFESITGKDAKLVFLCVGMACIGKILGTFLSALCVRVNWRKGLTLGFLMNAKGLLEIVVLNIGLAKQVINVTFYTIMVIMTLFTTFLAAPLATLAIYPVRVRKFPKTLLTQAEDGELRLLECVYGTHTVSSIFNFTEVFRGTRQHPLRVFLMHLIEMTERSSSIVKITRVTKHGIPYWNEGAEKKGHDQVVVAFPAHEELSRVHVVPLTSVSRYNSMHEDICVTAEDRRTSLIVMPYYKSKNFAGEDVLNLGIQKVTRNLLKSAPCSVAIWVDRGLGEAAYVSPSDLQKHVAVLFFGGPDDREALMLARRMAEHPGVSLTVIHFCPTNEAAVRVEIEQEKKDPPQDANELSAKASLAGRLDPKGLIEYEGNKDELALEPILSMMLESGTTKGDAHLVGGSKAALQGGEAEPLLSIVKGDVPLAGGSGTALQDVPPREDDSGSAEDKSGAALSQISFRPKVHYVKRVVDDAAAAVMAAAAESFDLFVVGRGRKPGLLVDAMTAQPPSKMHKALQLAGKKKTAPGPKVAVTDLGPVGDMLVASDTHASLLVIQQHDETFVQPQDEATVQQQEEAVGQEQDETTAQQQEATTVRPTSVV